jgi:hypothetical protein
MGGVRRGRGKGGEMTQTLYSHMKKIKIKKDSFVFQKKGTLK